ncbi:hypothetical protein GCM10010112_10300 [Actinoplanes lobatus]|nr:hypothetical protein GCM10010112_10300 [Actinoplanes lobatus]GIE37604.1 hypothetical protein Alo02nite_05020 [Actinoplanes lobatus]
MRAGDSDRQKVADQLKAALDEGRLDLSEYDDRVQRAYAAKTYGDLDGLLDDLPGTIPVEKSQVVPREGVSEPVAKPASKHQGRSGFPGMLGVFVVCTLVWAMSSLGSGELQYFWPGWVLIPVVLAFFAQFGKRRH